MRSTSWRSLGAVGVLVAGLLSACASGGTSGPLAPAPTTAEAALPLLTSAGESPAAGDLGDPAVLTVPPDAATGAPGRYVLFGTGDWPARIPTAVSTDLTRWTRGADAFPVLPTWSAPDPGHSLTWAPFALKAGGRWVLLLTVPDAAIGRQCIAVATSVRPEGPYADALGHPLVCQGSLGGSIDPSVVSTPTGLVLLWKSDGNCCKLPATLWSQPLRADALAVTGTPTALLSNDEPWQGEVVEEPAAVPASGGGWWLFYSGGAFDLPGYSIGVASCPTLAGPCTDRSPHPLVSSVGSQLSPGGLELFTDLGGHLRAVFDTWTRPPSSNGHYDCCRAIDLAGLTHL